MASLPAGLESEVKSCCLRLLSFPGGCAPRLSPRAGATRQGCMAGRSQRVIQRGSAGAARPSPGAPDRRAAPPPAATVQLQLLLSRRRLEPDTAAALGRSQLRGIGVATPVPSVSARDPPGPAAPSRSSALTARTTSSRAPAASSAPAPAPPLRSVLSRGPRSACAGVPKRSCPQVPPPAPPSRPHRGWERGRLSALGLQSFSSRCCSRNKRGGGVEDQ